MKKVLFIFAMCVLAGCANKADNAQKAAEEFLGAFLQNDFKKASQLCSDEFQQEFGRTIKDFENLDNSVKQMITDYCAQLKYEITLVERINKSDTFNVQYNIVKALPDSSSIPSQQMFSTSMQIVKDKIAKLNK